MPRRFLLLLVAIAVALTCAPCDAASAQTSKRKPTTTRRAPAKRATPAQTPPNVVIFLADDLGIGELGAWGQRELLTPNIDQLARDGMRLTELRSSAAVCGPARCSLMTGYHNGHCRLEDNDVDYLRTADQTLAERLKAKGYATGLFGKWGLSWDSQPESWPNAQGFDAFFGYRDQLHAHNYFPEYLLSNTDSLKTGNVVAKPGPMGTGRATTRVAYAPDLISAKAFAFVRANAKKPFLLYWATNLPHINNEGARGYDDGGYETTDLGPYADKPWPMAKKSYAAQVRRLDQDLGHLRALLDSLGVAKRTLIVFMSDNGATMLKSADDGKTNLIGRWFNGTMNFRGFKGDLYEGGLRVPGIVAWPGHVKPGSSSAVRADFTDVHATIADAAGVKAAPTLDGRSLVPALTAKGAVKERDYFVWFSPDRNQSAVLHGGWKGVWMRDTLQLFNVTSDPGETKDLVQLQPDVARRLTEIRAREDKRVPHPSAPKKP
ncbi:MAG: sulfatase-like hydrolase/transferase [Gemmatimonadota bacterium]|nr:sulfatase-like hydrolase/transferase [Gemmatimonadota bacterium]